MKQTILLLGAIFGLIGCSQADKEVSVSPNTLTEAEKAEGWSLLFDGKDLSSWRNYQKEGVDGKWKVADGVFTLTEKGGGDIITTAQYGAFELKLDYNISKGGNSGLMFHVTEGEKTPWMTGPEIQIQDSRSSSCGRSSWTLARGCLRCTARGSFIATSSRRTCGFASRSRAVIASTQRSIETPRERRCSPRW